MQFVIRADASIEIGTGHVMRCLALADYLREMGGQVTFISCRLDGHLAHLIKANGFEVELFHCENGYSVETDALQTQKILERFGVCDCLIVDNYALNTKWERALRSQVRKLFVIDDLANRFHDCDGLLDQNLHREMHTRYLGLVPFNCKCFLGPEYALLRREFLKKKRHIPFRSGVVRQVLINFGGSDVHDMASLAVMACAEFFTGTDIKIHVVAGVSNPYKSKLKELCGSFSQPVFIYHEQVSDMAGLMAESDLAIGAGGSSHWERCWLGLSAIVITTAANQVEITEAVAERGACVYLGDAERENGRQLKKRLVLKLAELAQHPHRLENISQRAFELMSRRDGFDAMIRWLSS